MNSLIPLFIIFIYATFFSNFLKKNITETIVFSEFLIILILYIFGISSQLELGWYLTCFISCILLFFLIKKNKNHKLNLSINYGLIFIVLTTMISIFIHKYRFVVSFDEFNHWFLAAKNMYLNNELFTSQSSNVLSKNYMPASTIFHYFWLKPNQTFNESLVFISMNFFLFSLLSIPISKFSKKQWKQALLSGFVLFLIPLTLYNYIYTGAYVDGLMGLILSYILYQYFTQKMDKFNFLSLLLGLSILTLTKTTGIILSIFAAVIISIDIIFFKNLKTK